MSGPSFESHAQGQRLNQLADRAATTLELAQQRCLLALNKARATEPELGILLDQLIRRGEAVLFGGFVRDALHRAAHNGLVQHRDLDVVVDGAVPPSEERTKLGGWRRRLPSNTIVDYWALEQTYAFKLQLFAPSLANLPKTTVFTINACYFSLTSHKIREDQATTDIIRKRIAFNCRGYLDAFPELQSFRALDYAERLGYDLEDEVSEFVTRTVKRGSREEFAGRVTKLRPDVAGSAVLGLIKKHLPQLSD